MLAHEAATMARIASLTVGVSVSLAATILCGRATQLTYVHSCLLALHVARQVRALAVLESATFFDTFGLLLCTYV